jgi:hypothetical protein
MDIVPTIQDARPPFVRFDQAEFGVDPEASAKLGHDVPRMIHMAYITPHGSKDVFEQPAEAWLTKIMAKAKQGDYKLEWARHFRAAFDEYLKGSELPREGTPLVHWSMIPSPTRRKQLVAAGIPTVEDLAAWPDASLGAIGLDGRYLRDIARGWITEAKDKGTYAKTLADANARIAHLESQNERLEAQNNKLAQRLEALEKKAAKAEAA